MILCCGEALIDMLPRKTEDGEDAFVPCAGGAVFNTAIALGRLGTPVGLFTGLSSDFFGDILRASLHQSGVSADLAVQSDRPTTLAFVKLSDGQAKYNFIDENSAGRMLSPADLPAIPDSVSTLFFGGISLAVEPCAAAYEELLNRTAENKTIMLDPNVRPGFIADEAAYRDRMDRMIANSDIVKLSDEDLRWLGGDGSLSDLAAAMLARGPKIVFVTEGAKGATAFTRNHEVSRKAVPVEVVDTVGAGDTFNAGLLAGLYRADALGKQGLGAVDETVLGAALELGIRAAAVTVSRLGANPPWAEEI